MQTTRTTRTIARTLLAIVAIGTLATELPNPGAFEAPVVESVAPTGADIATTAVNPAVAGDEALAEWALERFEIAGLELPPVIIIFHTDREGCRGGAGYYSHGARTVDMCERGESGDPRRTLLHELGHAWAFTHLSPEAIDIFVAEQGLADWSQADSWWAKGKERAAEIVAWGLQDDDEYESQYLNKTECSRIAASFELLTGIAPLHTNTEYCV